MVAGYNLEVCGRLSNSDIAKAIRDTFNEDSYPEDAASSNEPFSHPKEQTSGSQPTGRNTMVSRGTMKI